jgi:SAM-dependent methyltransferase
MNINTESYWNSRFISGDWGNKGGRTQTMAFARSIVRRMNLTPDFSGTIVDFGCGTGDAMPVYAEAFPKAKLIGLDFSTVAIDLCKKGYSNLADFVCGDFTATPDADIIIASNIFEHLSNDLNIAEYLKRKCRILYIVVPYKEELNDSSEHINTYDKTSFERIPNRSFHIFRSRGWSQFGFDLLFSTWFKNIFRFLFGKRQLNY